MQLHHTNVQCPCYPMITKISCNDSLAFSRSSALKVAVPQLCSQPTAPATLIYAHLLPRPHARLYFADVLYSQKNSPEIAQRTSTPSIARTIPTATLLRYCVRPYTPTAFDEATVSCPGFGPRASWGNPACRSFASGVMDTSEKDDVAGLNVRAAK